MNMGAINDDMETKKLHILPENSEKGAKFSRMMRSKVAVPKVPRRFTTYSRSPDKVHNLQELKFQLCDDIQKQVREN